VKVRASGALRSLVVRQASGGRALFHARLRDESELPAVDELRGWLDTIAAGTAEPTTIRTAALFPRAAERFEAAGFEVVDRLALLRADLDDETVRTNAMGSAGRRGDGATYTMRRHHFAAAAAVDRSAFSAEWGHDAAELAEICRATPAHAARFRVAKRSQRGSVSAAWFPGRAGRLIGFAIAGASPDHGYLQRLAVDPDAQRLGHGRELTLDALRWMIRHRLPDCMVNTSVDNAAALALYRSIGFTLLDEQLAVLHAGVNTGS
jgi:ribosomal protein S18 acetylase RimI-like enzyme